MPGNLGSAVTRTFIQKALRAILENAEDSTVVRSSAQSAIRFLAEQADPLPAPQGSAITAEVRIMINRLTGEIQQLHRLRAEPERFQEHYVHLLQLIDDWQDRDQAKPTPQPKVDPGGAEAPKQRGSYKKDDPRGNYRAPSWPPKGVRRWGK